VAIGLIFFLKAAYSDGFLCKDKLTGLPFNMKTDYWAAFWCEDKLLIAKNPAWRRRDDCLACFSWRHLGSGSKAS
jgi:hypothetical protein